MTKKLLGSDFEQWRRGDKINPPRTMTEWDELVINFFLTIHKVIDKENHPLKFDGKRQVCDILNDAAGVEGVNLSFFEVDGEWGLQDTDYSVEDLIRLGDVARRFSRIYRHHARDYSYNENQDVKMLLEGKEHGEDD